MTFYGINFRQSATHPSATDGPNDTYWHKAGNENFATAVRGAFTGGFGQRSDRQWINGGDRSGAGIDARLAGIVSSASAAYTTVFLITLPNGPGQYRIRLAAGDRLAARSDMSLNIRDGDGGPSLHLRSGISTGAANSFADVNGTVHTAADWPANNTTVTLTFTSSVASFEFGANFYINHIALEPVSGGGSFTVSGAGGIASAAAFGSPSVGFAGPFSVTGAGGIASATAFGSPSLSFSIPFAVSGAGGIASSNAFGTATLNFSANGLLNFQAAGMEFGRRTGLGISTFALDAGASYRYSVHADGLTLGAAILTSSAITLDSNGKLPNLSSASITTGTTYRVVAIRQADGEAATFRMVAQ